MKSTLRNKSTLIALTIGIIIGMLVPIAKTRAQVQTPFGTQTQPVRNPNNCEDYYQAAVTLAAAVPSQETPTSARALMYLACKEHFR